MRLRADHADRGQPSAQLPEPYCACQRLHSRSAALLGSNGTVAPGAKLACSVACGRPADQRSALLQPAPAVRPGRHKLRSPGVRSVSASLSDRAHTPHGRSTVSCRRSPRQADIATRRATLGDPGCGAPSTLPTTLPTVTAEHRQPVPGLQRRPRRPVCRVDVERAERTPRTSTCANSPEQRPGRLSSTPVIKGTCAPVDGLLRRLPRTAGAAGAARGGLLACLR